MRRKEVEMAKERGEEIAVLHQKKENLERDRQRLMDDLEKVRQGDISALRRNEASRWVANDIIQKGGTTSGGVDITKVKLDPAVKDKLVSDQVRINQLKQQHEKMMREALPELEELDMIARDWMIKNPGVRQQQLQRNDPFADLGRSFSQP